MKNLHNVSIFGLVLSFLCVLTGGLSGLPVALAVGFYSSPIWMFIFILTGGIKGYTPAPKVA